MTCSPPNAFTTLWEHYDSAGHVELQKHYLEFWIILYRLNDSRTAISHSMPHYTSPAWGRLTYWSNNFTLHLRAAVLEWVTFIQPKKVCWISEAFHKVEMMRMPLIWHDVTTQLSDINKMSPLLFMHCTVQQNFVDKESEITVSSLWRFPDFSCLIIL